jgi:G3E family GTPase
MTAKPTIPVTVIGGYLGAGKTTLVNHLLRHAGGRRIAVAVNEFGALPIDHDLIVGADGNVLTLAGGCICCTFGSDLVAGLLDLAARADSLDHILIEASGVALPGAIAQSVSLAAGLTLDCIAVVADAETVRARACDLYIADTITRQLVDADIVLLNKIDLAPAPDSLLDWLTPLAPHASLVSTTHGRVAPEVLFGLGSRFDAATTRPPHNAQGLTSEAFDMPHIANAEWLAAALAAPQLGLVRAKGFVWDATRGATLIQIVGRRHMIMPTASISSVNRLVCIAHGRAIDRGAIKAIINRAQTAL